LYQLEGAQEDLAYTLCENSQQLQVEEEKGPELLAASLEEQLRMLCLSDEADVPKDEDTVEIYQHPDRKVVCILGATGSGKSSLVNTISQR